MFKPYIVLKINTTGLSKKDDEITEIALIYEDFSYLNNTANPSLHLFIDNGPDLNKKGQEQREYLKDKKLVSKSEALKKITQFMEPIKKSEDNEIITVGIDLANFTYPFLNKHFPSLATRHHIDLKGLDYIRSGKIPSKSQMYKRVHGHYHPPKKMAKKNLSESAQRHLSEKMREMTALDECFLINKLFWKHIAPQMGM